MQNRVKGCFDLRVVSERVTLEVALRYWSSRYFKISIFGSKVPLCFLDMEKWQIR